jgi:DNA-binding transcriptional LysR family regulator
LNWDDVRYFLAVHRAGSLAGAGRSLGVNHTTVSRRVAALESSLGVRLFERTPEGVVLSTAGTAVLPPAEAMEQEMTALGRTARREDQRLEGTVRLTTSDTLATHFLIPHLGELVRAHPGIELDIVIGQALVNLPKREADIALRARPKGSPPGEGDLVARKVAETSFALFCSKAHAKKHRIGPDRHADPKAHPLLGYGADATWFPGEAWLRERYPNARFVLQANTIPALIAAIHADVGLAVLPCFVGHREGLVRVSGAVCWTEVWLAVHPDLRRAARVRVVLDALTELLERHRDDLRAGL